MNLTDGKVFCGRRYFDGTGGNNHALLHFQQTGFPLAVKLGTITPDGAGRSLAVCLINGFNKPTLCEPSRRVVGFLKELLILCSP